MLAISCPFHASRRARMGHFPAWQVQRLLPSKLLLQWKRLSLSDCQRPFAAV
jgi:hypothetical protein